MTGAAREIYESILLFAGGKRYVMRSPIRLYYALGWEQKNPGMINAIVRESREGSSRKRSSKQFGEALVDLERLGLIRRFPGGIEVLSNVVMPKTTTIPGYDKYPVISRNILED